MFPAPKQNIGGYKFRDDGEVETLLTQWLITEYTDFSQQGILKLA
jgi:hypothetical protein